MLDLSTVLKYYKRKEIQEAIVRAAENREVAVRFGDRGFGKRPDTLKYPSDVIELAKQGATSFHCSEEIWSNPLQISTNMRKQELDKLRTGWDLMLDIDCPNWTLSKIIAWLIITSLNDHGIKAISAKFSGNKGFHIGLPYNAMPETIRSQKTKDLFPEGPRKIAGYLIDYIGKKYTRVIENSIVEFGGKVRIPLKKIASATGKKIEDVTKKYCTECGKEIKKENKESVHFVCSKCETTAEGNGENVKTCPKCSSIMERIEGKKALCDCGSNSCKTVFEPSTIVEVDTILIASRHLYRMPYSLHEKSGLASVPVDPEKIMLFEKDMAKPENVEPEKRGFLEKNAKLFSGEAENLLLKSMHYGENIPENETGNGNEKQNIMFEQLTKALPEQLFPPCIKNILKGIVDGKKRSVFILMNFLTNVGWDYEKIEPLLNEWNKKNPEPLRETILLGQFRYHKQNKKKVLPPNCDNLGYYKGFSVCKPDNFCSKIKNPVSYSIRKSRFMQDENEKKK